MEKKGYVSPEIKEIKIEATSPICMSGNNGNHYGWNNPHNPHYTGDDEEEYDF